MQTIPTRNNQSLEFLLTARLQATRISEEDFADFYKMNQDPKAMATLGGVRSAAETQQNLSWNRQKWQNDGFGIWVFRTNDEAKQFVGRGGLRQIEIYGRNEIEVGYALIPEFWGKGLATEIAQLSIEVAFTCLKSDNVIALALPDNYASRKVIEKTGFQLEGNITHDGASQVIYRLTAFDYWSHHIQFHPMRLEDIELWKHWLTKPHVKEVWDFEGDRPTDKIRNKVIGNGYDYPFLIDLDKKPIGYIQACDLYAYAKLYQQHPELYINAIAGDFGIDLFIGEDKYLSKGYGTVILRLFTHKIFVSLPANAIYIDPNVTNPRALNCYKKALFQMMKTFSHNTQQFYIMRLQKSFHNFLLILLAWARKNYDIVAIALVGSYARNQARDDSDIDLVLILNNHQRYLDNHNWIHEFGAVKQIKHEDYGKVQSLRAYYCNSLEIEFGLTTREWVNIPIDNGTKKVIKDGMKILFDPNKLLEKIWTCL